MIQTINDYLTSSGKYPERSKSPECTVDVIESGLEFVTKCNALFYELGLKVYPKFSSGFRDSESNKKARGAKKSLHMTGHAGDFEDPEEKLDDLLMLNLKLLEKHGLYLESPRFTKGWSHLQDIPPRSGKRVFIP